MYTILHNYFSSSDSFSLNLHFSRADEGRVKSDFTPEHSFIKNICIYAIV